MVLLHNETIERSLLRIKILHNKGVRFIIINS